jgi:hypothetical protein
LIISDALIFNTNGNEQKVILEAWGQDAYYHYPTDAIYFDNGTYLAYSLISSDDRADTIWKKDKPHVIYGYLVVDSLQKLTIEAGVNIYLNYRAGLWVYRGGQLRVLGQKGNEVTFQGARREKEFSDDPGQWDRIWINEGSDNNVIDYAIIKNGYIGVQVELLGNDIFGPGSLRLTNTKIQNMSMWGVYGLGYKLYAGNNVISNCQEHCVNLLVGGSYKFYHCTITNFFTQGKFRDKPAINLSNYTIQQVIWDTVHFRNCIIDGALSNEIRLDFKTDEAKNIKPDYEFRNTWLKTGENTSDPLHYINVRKDGDKSLNYKDASIYNFEPAADESRIRNFDGPGAEAGAQRFVNDLNNTPRKTTIGAGGITAGAYEVP